MSQVKTSRSSLVADLLDRPVFLISILSVCSVVVIAFYISDTADNLVETVALEDAALYSQAIEELFSRPTSPSPAITHTPVPGVADVLSPEDRNELLQAENESLQAEIGRLLHELSDRSATEGKARIPPLSPTL